MNVKLKKQAFKIHRLLFLGLGLLMLIWFLSGIVMMYKGFPNQYRDARGRLTEMTEIEPETVQLSFEEAFEQSGTQEELADVRLGTLLNRPAYFFLPKDGKWITVFADTGQTLESVSQEFAMQSARLFSGIKELRFAGKINAPDQWTVGTASRPGYWPFYKFVADDSQKTEVYVSRASGEVLQLTTRGDRLFPVAWTYSARDLLSGHPKKFSNFGTFFLSGTSGIFPRPAFLARLEIFRDSPGFPN